MVRSSRGSTRRPTRRRQYGSAIRSRRRGHLKRGGAGRPSTDLVEGSSLMFVPWWAWVLVMGAVAVMLAVDLFLHRDNHVIDFREAATWSAVWIGAGLLFGVLLWWWQ